MTKNLLLFFILVFNFFIIADDIEDYSIRFRSGKIIAAELIPGESCASLIKNVNPNEPPSKINTDVAYAAIIVTLDPGRSLSIYDYILKDSSGQQFPCVAIKEKDEYFDASKWLYENAPQNNRFTMLFRVQMPPPSQPFRYTLEFNLLKSKESVSVPFVRLKDKPLTQTMLFPENGIVLAPSETIKEFYAKIYKSASETPAPTNQKTKQAK